MILCSPAVFPFAFRFKKRRPSTAMTFERRRLKNYVLRLLLYEIASKPLLLYRAYTVYRVGLLTCYEINCQWPVTMVRNCLQYTWQECAAEEYSYIVLESNEYRNSRDRSVWILNIVCFKSSLGVMLSACSQGNKRSQDISRLITYLVMTIIGSWDVHAKFTNRRQTLSSHDKTVGLLVNPVRQWGHYLSEQNAEVV